MRMEASGGNSDAQSGGISTSGGNNIGNSRRHGVQLSAANLLRSPLSTLLEYSGILRTRSSHSESDTLIHSGVRDQFQPRLDDAGAAPALAGGSGEVSIRIIGTGDQEHDRVGTVLPTPGVGTLREADGQNEVFGRPISRSGSAASVGALESQLGDRGAGDGQVNGNTDLGSADGASVNNRESSYQRYDIQQAARWIEQIIPFSLLLLIVFIRQHLQGFFVTILIAAVMFKSNDIVKKQTALKGERKISVLIGICLLFSGYVIGFYWWYRNDDLLSPLLMLPPKDIPPFWHAIFMIMVNDTLVRQAAMVFKCLLLMYYKNSRGRNYRKQGQLLTLVEYLLLLYRALLPAPVWYRFFLNKEYGSLFSSLMTGLYLTFKLTSVVEKVQSFFTALKALSRKEIHYGVYATSEQVNAAGDLCAICQEKMHTPILLRCKHIFCEDCVSEWFERERTCPLCRSLVKPADLKSFGDGSTSLFFQLF
ncbi:putative RING finger and transmembrane domain-containing protein 2-like isoform X2 [Capsicum annuum]|uniref:RING finger and transmembrane domain-containing protein 2 n=1 Tax=Capsicum annuum TaxID=4072 RepID=UPI001FB0FA73|nr:RING finger and transmembrane domain-containing protein 2 [Capsicum annuum]XP_016545514.2 RING finger and transmembrane domain-containing protein 2 [Capsicum annuum]XP_016545515.2 RING finger and transmembrane domain-containing protein 2 [Capsicum annuum]KAF3627023.1 putative RING finger and transmembrane domain-containing protein 2-like isoform X2 [Capsicum annuum]KAF3634632.1 putative RING finger and transmembrane domain-containing protein 2-like isoform X2 [Capsicum annuum]